MSFFDFSAELRRAVTEAPDEATRWCARTEIGRPLFPRAVGRAGFSLLQPQSVFSPGACEHVLVVGAASCSDPDLAALDRLAQQTRALAYPGDGHEAYPVARSDLIAIVSMCRERALDAPLRGILQR